MASGGANNVRWFGDRTVLIVVALVLIGVELTTRAGSLAWVRLVEGWSALTGAGRTVHVPTEQYLLGLALFALAGGTVFFLSLRGLTVRQLGDGSCPRCGDRTKRIRRTPLQRFIGPLLGPGVSRRKCRQCDWSGLARKY